MLLNRVDFTLETHGPTTLLVDRSCVSEAFDDVFSPERGQKMRDGRGLAYQVRGSYGTAVWRHYRRGGLTGSLWQDRYVFRGLDRSRPARELHLMADLFARGLPVPQPLAARVVRSGMFYRADLLTRWLEGAKPLSALIREVEQDHFKAIGAMLARFHDAGLYHADLNAHNILQTNAGMALIDFDRCELRVRSESWTRDNLARLLRSLTKLGFGTKANFQSELWPALLGSYATHGKRP
jgi:3-deoxy-D-manno-octulosonic acid kinase